jgi:Patatin-like phospholipase
MADTTLADVPPTGAREEMARFDLRDANSYGNPQLKCDLIMKGGITSGVIYPQAVCRLATRYQLKQIGGASAGAIAAALSAAAEYHRQHPTDAASTHGKPAGFVRLAGIPTELGPGLGALFQPVRATRPAHSVLMAAVAPGRPKPLKVLGAIGALIKSAPLVFLVALAITLVPLAVWAWADPGRNALQDWTLLLWPALAWLPGGLLVAVLATAAWVLWQTTKALKANGFGLTNGHSTDGRQKNPPLTDWMIATIDETAGVKSPLTFKDLWGEDATTVYRHLRQHQAGEDRITNTDWRNFKPDIDLKVMTTNLTLRKPHQFPFTSGDFYYCPRCWQTYFPHHPIMKHLEKFSREEDRLKTITSDSTEQHVLMSCPRHGNEEVRIRTLPEAPDLPVVVAARISLSFPGLISALPLLCIDYSRKPGRREIITCWFSDGGIASNFPMHFFDSPWPIRPTFGLNLDKVHRDYKTQMVWRPLKTLSGVFPRSHEPESMFGFLTAVMLTMQNWVDASQVTMPGFRDRITEVRTGDGEGGLNLRMDEKVIETLAERGSQAALEFADFDLPLHQWVRYRVAMNALTDSLDMMSARWSRTEEGAGFQTLIDRYAGTPGDYHLEPAAACADAEATKELILVAEKWEQAGYPATAPLVPEPKPRLRQMPPL